jgi:hypothetical protein
MSHTNTCGAAVADHSHSALQFLSPFYLQCNVFLLPVHHPSVVLKVCSAVCVERIVQQVVAQYVQRVQEISFVSEFSYVRGLLRDAIAFLKEVKLIRSEVSCETMAYFPFLSHITPQTF